VLKTSTEDEINKEIQKERKKAIQKYRKKESNTEIQKKKKYNSIQFSFIGNFN